MGVMTPRYVYEKTVSLTGAGGGGSTLKTGLISFWELDEASGTRVDAHTGGNDLADNNTVTQAVGWGGAGNAAQFTAANSESLSRASNSSLQTGGKDFSIAFSFYVDSFPATPAIVSKGGAFANREFRVGTKFTSGFRLVFAAWDNGGATLHELFANTFGNLSTATFYFGVVSYNTTTGEMSISINAGTADTTTITGPISNSTGDFVIGAFEGSDFWNGRIQRLALWNKVLSSAEITQLYNGGTPLSYAQL